MRVAPWILLLLAAQPVAAATLEDCRALVARKAYTAAVAACEDLQYETAATPEAFYLLGVSHAALGRAAGQDKEHHRVTALDNLRRFLDDAPASHAHRRAAIVALLRAEAAGETPDAAVLTIADELAKAPDPTPEEASVLAATFGRHGRVSGTRVVMAPIPPVDRKPFDPGDRGLTGALRVGRDVPEPRKVHHRNPVYPDIAKQARVQGTVTLDCRVDERGHVVETMLLRGIPLLDPAAADAVAKWRYAPTIVNGEAVPVLMTVVVTFRLAPD